MGVLNFSQYIKEDVDDFEYIFGNLEEELLDEAKKEQPREFNVNDAKGKLYEILAGSHLQHGTHKNGTPKQFLTHYRDEEGKTPQDVHNYIKSELDARHPGMYNAINQHAMSGAKHIKEKLASMGHHTVHDTAWTSQLGDHERFTGKHDPNSDADVMLRTNKGHVGVSMKYGESKDMNLRNNGLEALERMVGLKKGDVSSHRSNHQNKLKELGILNHQDYKAKRDSNDPNHLQAVAHAEESALNAQKNMAGALSGGLSKMNHQQLKDYVGNLIAPKTVYPHFRIHTRPLSNGDAVHHFEDTQADRAKLDDFEHLRAKPSNGAISFNIEGKRKGSSNYEPVTQQAIKKGSGPTKGFASTLKAPFLTKKIVTPPGINPDKSITVAPQEIVNPPKAKAKPLRAIKKKVATQPMPAGDGSVGGYQF